MSIYNPILGRNVWRDFVTDGVPSSGPNQPNKLDIRRWAAWLENAVVAFLSNGGVIYATLAEMNADLGHAPNSMAWVLGDPVVANNGIYMKLGASGAGSWQRISDLPFSFIIASNAGAGAPDAIKATTDIPVSPSAMILLQIAENYAGDAATVSFNGASPITIKTNSGEDVHRLAAGSVVYGVISGNEFRLANDEAIASLIYAARDAAIAAADHSEAEADRSQNEADRSEEARDIAAGFASDIVSQGNVPIYATIDGMGAIEVPEGINGIRVNGQQSVSDGLGGFFSRSAVEPSSNRKFQSAGGVWWDFVRPLLYPGGRKNLGDVIRKSRAGSTISIAFYGDSIFYGQDTVSAGLLPPANGATQTRSPNPMPETLSNALFFSNISANIVNRSFPGDNTRLGISRWASASATDVAFVMYGHNDANNYGGAGIVPVDEYRINLGFIVERELAKGAAVVVFGPPPVFVRDEDKVLRSYVSAARRVAEQYGLPFIDLSKQLSSIYDSDVNPTGLMWTDGVHLSPAAYVECGSHLAALFTHGELTCRASPGAEYFVEDRIFDEWASTYRQNPDADAGWTHYLVALPQNTNLSIACDVEEDCIPVITMINATGSARAIKLYYAQGLFTPVRPLVADSSAGLRSRVKGPKIRRGLRLLHVRNDDADVAYIESIRFERVDSVATSRGVYRKSELSGVCAPSVNWFGGVWWAARDDTALLPRGSVMETRMMLPHDTISGISLMKNRDVADDYLSNDQIMVLRSGTDLIVRKLVAGIATDTTVAGVFTAGLDFVGCLTLQVGSNIKASVDGALKATVSSPNINAGYAAILSLGISRMRCDAMTILQ
ncbi:GDSL-type esterase/lipase family protein [Agrobacterium tumefaciens]|uniref:SGNH/GDSL hydrolase family protein n=1 Tax=Agrobacterium tumefaciens TaxID=358 RepID=UPI0015733251|nr:GDSL-type esterase/lipase family protein [Agrobacterium tumefaciens]NSZ65160.1 hypothetical protein [Agrobacterium tumefaciens]NTA71531.1 hypothetical protein [Agrobacterium tumefaciens]WIE40238.1 GDSL-type esterase/lipase family protein [Agrobacterium tumefaciens]